MQVGTTLCTCKTGEVKLTCHMEKCEPGGWLHQLASWRRRKDCRLTSRLLLLPKFLLAKLCLDLLLDPLLLLL